MTDQARGLLLIISGPSGVGKGRICEALLSQDKNTVYSVSATTRAPRAREKDGVNYHFISREEFREKREAGQFLEWAEVYGNYYGTLSADVDRLLAEGKNVILEIDTQGAAQIKSVRPDGLSVFILPPSFKELKRRIVSRGSETPAMLALRLSRAESEIAAAKNYDYQIVNDDVEQAAARLRRIISDELAIRRNIAPGHIRIKE